jgi:hypothetical protein
LGNEHFQAILKKFVGNSNVLPNSQKNINLLNLLKTFYRGLAYDATASPQRPKGAIQRITSTNPNSEESPFHDPTG